MKNFQITQWCARFIKEQVSPGDLCIDATMGNGNDTLLLSTLCGKDGRVIAFDIQEQAVKSTKERLSKADAPDNYTLLLESHTQMSSYAKENSVSCITFNLGYLPGGDHGNQKRQQHCSSDAGTLSSQKRRSDLSLHLQWRRFRLRGTGCSSYVACNT